MATLVKSEVMLLISDLRSHITWLRLSNLTCLIFKTLLIILHLEQRSVRFTWFA